MFECSVNFHGYNFSHSCPKSIGGASIRFTYPNGASGVGFAEARTCGAGDAFDTG
jgi:hypothetical protein